jgi:hypothetical protein
MKTNEHREGYVLEAVRDTLRRQETAESEYPDMGFIILDAVLSMHFEQGRQASS